MPEFGTSRDLLVSVQERGREDRPDVGHLASGVLVGRDQVLVPGLVEGLRDPEREIEVLVFTARPNLESPVERIGVTRIDTCRNGTGWDRPLGTLIALDRPSRHAPSVSTIDGCRFDEVLAENGGDVRRTLERMGLVPTTALDRPQDDVLREAGRIERAQRQPVRRDVVFPGGVNFPICPAFLPCCRPCPPG